MLYNVFFFFLVLLNKLVPFQRIVSQWNAFCFAEAKRSLVFMPNKPLQHVITKHVISICFPLTNENKDTILSSLHTLAIFFLKHFQVLAKIQPARQPRKNPVFVILRGGYRAAFCARCTLTIPAFCWIHCVPKSHNPIRDTWLVELIRARDIVSHLWIKSHGPVS